MKPMILTLYCLFACSFVFAAQSNSIQIKGSDTMVNLTQAWAERYMEKNPKSFIAVTGGGSGTGITSLINGTCNIASSSRKMGEKEIDQAKQVGIKPKDFTVALDGIAVVVNINNPIDKLTLQQLTDLYTGKITNWKELGGNDSPVVLLSREVNSGTHVYFKEHVLQKGDKKNKTEFSVTALLMPSSQSIADEIAQNPNTIGYYGIGYINPSQKAVAIAKDENSPYVEPTVENVKNGTYYISRPLFLYTKEQLEKTEKDFIDYVFSKEGQSIVLEQDFVPVV